MQVEAIQPPKHSSKQSTQPTYPGDVNHETSKRPNDLRNCMDLRKYLRAKYYTNT
jgi:hypothetical protein